jgi:hypothetical protein
VCAQADWFLGQRNIRVDKIIPLEEERQVMSERAGIGKAIAHI